MKTILFLMLFIAVIRYGTVSVPTTLGSVGEDSGRDGYLVLNIEFDQTYYLLGFEFYASNTGSVQTAVNSFYLKKISINAGETFFVVKLADRRLGPVRAFDL